MQVNLRTSLNSSVLQGDTQGALSSVLPGLTTSKKAITKYNSIMYDLAL